MSPSRWSRFSPVRILVVLALPAIGMQTKQTGLDDISRSTFPMLKTYDHIQQSFPGGAGRFGVRRTRIRERGLPLELVVISDLTQALSEQELQAWQRLVRVLGDPSDEQRQRVAGLGPGHHRLGRRERGANDPSPPLGVV